MDFTPDISNSNLPPQNIEAEEIILGGMLFDKNAVEKVIGDLPTEAFYVPAHRTIYNAIKALHKKGMVVDLITVTTKLNDLKLLDRAGGNSKIASLINLTVTASNIERYIPLVLDKYTRRKLLNAGRDISQISFDNERTTEEVLTEAETKIFSISQEGLKQNLIRINESLEDTLGLIEKAGQDLITPKIMTGFYDLDELTGGLGKTDFVIIAGRTAMGKSALAQCIALNIAKQNIGVAIFSLEMSTDQVNIRLLSIESKITSDRIEKGKLTQNEATALSKAIGSLSELPIYINSDSRISIFQISSQIKKLQAQEKGNIGIVIVDYIQLLGGNTNNRVQELANITREMKRLADETNTVIIGLAQVNRGTESRNNKRPNLGDLRESGSTEQDANLVLMVYRDEYYNPNSEDEGIAEIIVAKNRGGKTGTTRLLFDSDFTLFKNLKR